MFRLFRTSVVGAVLLVLPGFHSVARAEVITKPDTIKVSSKAPKPSAVCAKEKVTWMLTGTVKEPEFVRKEAVKNTFDWTWEVVKVQTNAVSGDPKDPNWKDDPDAKTSVKKKSQELEMSEAELEATFVTSGFKMVMVKATLKFKGKDGKDYVLNGTGPATVPVTAIVPDEMQQGVTGDLVASTKGDSGEKHYVSPKKAKAFVILKAEAVAAKDFQKHFEWEGGEAVKDSPEKRKVARDATGKTVVKLLTKKEKNKSVCDLMNVWIVWATIEKTRVQNIMVTHANVQPREGGVQMGTLAESEWKFVATIEPASILEADNDVPELRGGNTQPVPGAAMKHIITGKELKEGADKKWDVSRQIRVRFKDPVIPSSAFDKSAEGKLYDGLPADNIVQIEYPDPDSAIGTDDTGTHDEDNNPYSDTEVLPGTTENLPKGKIGSHDTPVFPVFIDAPGNNGAKLEAQFQFGEFVRLQIGDKADAGYKNWYRISDFALWRHDAKLKKAGGTWVDDGSVAETNNNNWE